MLKRVEINRWNIPGTCVTIAFALLANSSKTSWGADDLVLNSTKSAISIPVSSEGGMSLPM